MVSEPNLLAASLSFFSPVFFFPGESYNNIHGRIGGDSELSPRGERFAEKLSEYVKKVSKENPNVRIWTSWMKRTIDTAKHIDGIQER